MKLTIVIPTYNERENLKPLIEEILKVIPLANIFIVDDNSPDGTGKIAEKLTKLYSQIKILHRPKKEGIGKAYIFAFKEILKTNTEYILQMDADFSHPPKYIPQMIKELENYDIVLCSRYLNKKNIKLSIFSFLANQFVRLILGPKISDPLGGFKCFKRKVIESIEIDRFISYGFIFQAEFIYKAIKKNFKTKELPFLFSPRRAGKSKKTTKTILEAFIKIWLLKLI
ncbi:MAG: polyprenol monophosphomannose synthase [Candidatus Omnitrophica bacterium]|nr:polyprenol monophosphomannose synthase [Candidatus Omnitrophota bacterium]